VLVTTNQLIIPFAGAYATNKPVMLGNYSLAWQQTGKSSNIVATLPANLPAGTYSLVLKGAPPVSVEIGSVTGIAALNARVDAEIERAQNAEAGQTKRLNAEVTRANAAEAGLSNSISTETLRAMNAEADLANYINAISNSLASTFDSRISAVSNQILASVTSTINASSNSIVASLTKNFTAAFAFGLQGVNNNADIAFSSFIGDWTTNGTHFKIPETGVYQISFMIHLSQLGNGSPQLYPIKVNVSNDTSTNGLGYFLFSSVGSVSGQTTVQCIQNDLISIKNATGTYFNLGESVPTNFPSATLSIIQIQ
jgi:hypothetical protein